MAQEIELAVPYLRYDITLPLSEGRVPIDGVKLVRTEPAPQGAAAGAVNPLQTGDFGLAEMNMAGLLPMIEAGWEISGLPLFVKRKPVYSYLICRSTSGINVPKDLEGKRIWSSLTGGIIALWMRGFLKHRHGVDVEKIIWVVGRSNFPNHNPSWKSELFEERKTALELLDEGIADAILTDIQDTRAWDRFEHDPKFKRVFPNYMDEDRRVYEETGVFTPMHMMAMSKKLDRQHPDLAGLVFAAFEKSKQIAQDEILGDRAGYTSLYLRERVGEELREWGDLFAYGITANKRMLDTFLDYAAEQGVSKNRLSFDQLFAAGTLDT